MSEKKEGPILVMAVVTLVLIVVMAGVSVMTLYTALYPPDFEKRAEQAEQGQIEEANSEGSAEESEMTPPDSSDVSQ
ncbi:MAG: hypothetical protein VXY07_00175 [Planctomycetota bacterium]|jgi:hypothetical protein|nr:hypothetical protein [Planctomycetota bacterium]MEC7428727.1 hypothetical protein [Planctomycetota bacterium]MEC7497991.1 hypothetical protein [Planctomycetota bacterium]MEC7717369.1 hypothetical protein [Planctomycetota bacterium]MEC8301114.1 hypothetical protein [Planctomycetota bacterium]